MSERTVNCPYCGKPTLYSTENTYRPFCSERCQTLDLGSWATEKYAIPGKPVPPETEVNQNQTNDEDDSEFDLRH